MDMSSLQEFLDDIEKDTNLSYEDKAEMLLFFLWPAVSKKNIDYKLEKLDDYDKESHGEATCLKVVQERFDSSFIVSFYHSMGDDSYAAH